MTNPLPRCPHCDALMIVSPDGDRLWCQFCGIIRDDPDALQRLEQYQASRAEERTAYEPPSRSIDLSLEQRRMLDSAWDSLQDNDLITAAYILREAVRQYPSFADAWYLLSKTTTSRTDQLMYLNEALTAQPYHEYAWRDKGVLEGVIPAGEGHTADLPDPEGPVEADSITQSCPCCGGTLAYDAESALLICAHCGFRPGVPGRAWGGQEKLDNALLKRRFGFAKEWHIGERVLVCQNCCAQLTLPGTTLSTTCPFCDTAHVLVQDAVGSFEQPDGVLPFGITRQAAAQAVHRAMSPDLRSQVERGDLLGVYLPFWAFDLSKKILEGFQEHSYHAPTVLVAGVNQPRQSVLQALMPFDLSALAPYDARYLAQQPAQIYSIDVIQASITGWAYLKQAILHAIESPSADAEFARSDSSYPSPDMPAWQFSRIKAEGLEYRLLLLPVWMVTLHLCDDSHRPAVVNGQTGEVVISASFVRPDQIVVKPDRPRKVQPLRRQPVIRPITPERE